MPRPELAEVSLPEFQVKAVTSEIDDRFQLHLQGLLTAFRDIQQNYELVYAGESDERAVTQVALSPQKESKIPSSTLDTTMPSGSNQQDTQEIASDPGDPSTPLQAQDTLDSPQAADIDLSSKRSELLELFTDLDTDHSGLLGIDEMREALRAIGLPPARARRLLEAADENGDGQIAFDEWSQSVDSIIVGKATGGMTTFAQRMLENRRSLSVNGIGTVTYEDDAKMPFLMVHYHSPVRVAWDIVLAVLLLYLVIILPFLFAFSEADDSEAFNVIGIFVDIVFLSDIVMNFRTSYLNKEGTEIIHNCPVALNYLRSWFILDLWSSLPLEYVSAGTMPDLEALKLLKGGKIIKVLKILRAVKLFKLLSSSQLASYMEEFMLNSNMQVTFDVLSVLVSCTFLCHILACFMRISGSGFLDYYLHAGNTMSSRYCSAFYWAVTTVTTVGYGDIVPTTDEERLFTMAAMVVGGAFYGYVVGFLSMIVAQSGTKKKEYRERMRNFAAWLQENEFPPELRRRLWVYYKSHEHKTGVAQTSILDDLSPELRYAACDFLLHPDIRNNVLFHDVPKLALARLLSIVQQIRAEPGEQVAARGQLGQAMFIITEGAAQEIIYKDNGESPMTTSLDAGDSFGEEILLGMKQNYDYTVTATTKCVLIMIRKRLFAERFTDLPQVLEQMRQNLANHAMA